MSFNIIFLVSFDICPLSLEFYWLFELGYQSFSIELLLNRKLIAVVVRYWEIGIFQVLCLG